MPVTRDELLRTLIPPAAAVALTLIFFAIFDRWTRIADPINSIVTLVAGALGFALGVFIDVRRAARHKGPPASEAASKATT